MKTFKKLLLFSVVILLLPIESHNFLAERKIVEQEIDFFKQPFYIKRKMVIYEIVKSGMQHPEIVLAQAMLESANFNSYIFRTNNNMFGMRMPNRRKTHAIDTYKGYAVYEDWKMSIQDYALYQKAILRGKTISEEAYLNFLGRKYAESPEYVAVLKKMIRKIKNDKIIT
jgi:uncharacterized FlgJ-related protein